MSNLVSFSRRIRKSNKLHLLIIIIFLDLMNAKLIRCLDRKAASNGDEDYGIYNNVANIISAQQQSKRSHPTNHHVNQPTNQQPDFKPSNWTAVSMDRLRKMRSENYDKFRRYVEYSKYLRSKAEASSDDDNYSNSNYNANNNYQFKRRSDLDDDYYYSPSYYPSANHYVYPPAIQPVISLPAPSTVLAATSPTYYHHHTYRKYRPSASRNYYHRIYPPIAANAAAIRRRLAASSSNYEAAAVPYSPSGPSGYQSYYYGTGLASHPQVTLPQTPAFPSSHGLAHASEHHDMHHEGKEVHSLLPIITVIGIGAFMIPLLTTFFTAMISSGGSCCQRQKERQSFDVKHDFYRRVKDAWSKAEKAIGKEL